MNKFFVLLFLLFAISMYSAEDYIKNNSTSFYLGLRNINEFGFNNFIGFQTAVQDSKAVWLEFGINSNNVKFDKKTDEGTTLNIYQLGIGFTYYVFQKSAVAAYVAPEFSLGIAYEETLSNEEVSTIKYDAGLNFGLEWWALESISLRASTFIGYTGTNTSKTAKPQNIEVYSWSFGILADTKSKFLISFYF